MRFDHVVVTRYSAVFTADQPAPQPEWLDYRLGFFVDACYASMTRQVPDAPVTWLVFLDDRCPDDFRETIEVLAEGAFEPVWTREVFWSGIVPDAVAARSSAPYVVATRLDSDDAVAKDFVASVQAEVTDKYDRLFLNFPRGLQVARGGAVYLRDHPSNSFISLVERVRPDAPPMTVFGGPGHDHVRRVGPIREVITDPMWVQVIHGSNLMNRVRGTRVSPRRWQDRFDIDLGYDHRPSLPQLAVGKSLRWGNAAAHVGRHPSVARQWATGKVDRVRGTRTKPQRP